MRYASKIIPTTVVFFVSSSAFGTAPRNCNGLGNVGVNPDRYEEIISLITAEGRTRPEAEDYFSDVYRRFRYLQKNKSNEQLLQEIDRVVVSAKVIPVLYSALDFEVDFYSLLTTVQFYAPAAKYLVRYLPVWSRGLSQSQVIEVFRKTKNHDPMEIVRQRRLYEKYLGKESEATLWLAREQLNLFSSTLSLTLAFASFYSGYEPELIGTKVGEQVLRMRKLDPEPIAARSVRAVSSADCYSGDCDLNFEGHFASLFGESEQLFEIAGSVLFGKAVIVTDGKRVLGSIKVGAEYEDEPGNPSFLSYRTHIRSDDTTPAVIGGSYSIPRSVIALAREKRESSGDFAFLDISELALEDRILRLYPNVHLSYYGAGDDFVSRLVGLRASIEEKILTQR